MEGERKPLTPHPSIPLSLPCSRALPLPSLPPSLPISEMVLRCSEIDKAQKPSPVAATVGPSLSAPFKNPRLRWGSTCRMLFRPNISGHRRPNDGHPPPPASHQAKNDRSRLFSVPFKNPMLRWGSSTHCMCCQVVSNHHDATDRRPSSASPSPPPMPHQTKNDPTLPPGCQSLVLRIPWPHQSKNDPTPLPGCLRLMIRIPCQAQAKVPDREHRPPARSLPRNQRGRRRRGSCGDHEAGRWSRDEIFQIRSR